MKNVITACWGPAFPDEYVLKTKAMVERNTTIPHRFICFSDREIEGVETIRLQGNEPTFWNKMEIFKESGVFLDLDLVITGNIDWLLEYDGEFMGTEDLGAVNKHQPHLKGVLQSSVLSWQKPFGDWIYNYYQENKAMAQANFRGDGEFLNWLVPKDRREHVQYLYPGELASYKYQVYNKGVTTESIIDFHGRPNVHNAITETTKTSMRTYQPRPWIKEYWKI